MCEISTGLVHFILLCASSSIPWSRCNCWIRELLTAGQITPRISVTESQSFGLIGQFRCPGLQATCQPVGLGNCLPLPFICHPPGLENTQKRHEPRPSGRTTSRGPTWAWGNGKCHLWVSHSSALERTSKRAGSVADSHHWHNLLHTLFSFALHSSHVLKRSCWCGPEWATYLCLRWHRWPLCNDSDLSSVGWLEPGRPRLSEHWWPQALQFGWQSEMLSPPNQTKIPKKHKVLYSINKRWSDNILDMLGQIQY